MLFSSFEKTEASVLIWISCMNVNPTCKVQSNMCKKLPNKSRKGCIVTLSFLLLLFERWRIKLFKSFLFGKSDFGYTSLPCDFSTLNSMSQGIFGLCCLNQSIFCFLFLSLSVSLKAGMWLAFQPRKHEGTWCPFSYGTSLGLSQFTIGLNFVSKPDGGFLDTIS